MTKNKMQLKLDKALEIDNTIVVSEADLSETKGFTTEYMSFVGLSKNDLKYLERHGLAKRGYGKLPVGSIFKGHKTEVRWVLVVKANEGA